MKYGFITYENLYLRLDKLVNKQTFNQVRKMQPIAYTSCGFPVDLYEIGNGNKHLVIMAGTHGTEIIGPDLIIQMMEYFANEPINLRNITLDFIPLQNPEGFIVVTESIKPYVNNLSEDDFENISKEYWNNYRLDDRRYLLIDNLLKSLGDKNTDDFWNIYRNKDIEKEDVWNFCLDNFEVKKNDLLEKWRLSNMDSLFENSVLKVGNRYSVFGKINYDMLPDKDERYKKLKSKIKSIMDTDYNGYKFPSESLIDWRCNSNGVDLNRNCKEVLEFKLEELKKNPILYGNNRFNNLRREIPGPQGMASRDFNNFTFEAENEGFLLHLQKLCKCKKYLGCITYHGTGAVIYCHPLKPECAINKEKVIKIDKINEIYADIYSSVTGYSKVDYPERITGTGDMIRNLIPGFLLVELSRMGGNPLSPYGDKNGNYKSIIKDNIAAVKKLVYYFESLNIKKKVK